MLTRNSFSYAEYKEIINHLKNTNQLLDYSEVTNKTDNFFVIRHDVEFSVERAHDLAIFEKHSLNLNSSYFFQIRNNCYNLCSETNIAMMHDMLSMGHKLGLHLHLGLKTDESQLIDYILQEIDLFQRVTGITTDRFSYHRPTTNILNQYHKIDGLINCYSDTFFQYYDTEPKSLNVKYYTDSRHCWQHGHPLDNSHKKVQLLTHPYSWSQKGAGNVENFSNILEEKNHLMKQSINNETSTFPHHLLR